MYEFIDIKPNFRYERKFTVTDSDREIVLQHIRLHPSFFSPVFHPRKINNIYLDTANLQCYKDNKIGIANRKKVRIRWYGNTFGVTVNPKLEYKLKSGLLGDKWTFDLPAFSFEQGFDADLLSAIYAQAKLPAPIMADLKQLQPTLLNSYQRSYFLSADKDFRLTFDENLHYYRIGNGIHYFMEKKEDLRQFILELKYTPDCDERASYVGGAFPFRMDKSSKYVNGIDFLQRSRLL